jgi:hypothetical protein
MRPLRIFTWHVHGSYLYYLAQGQQEIYLPTKTYRALFRRSAGCGQRTRRAPPSPPYAAAASCAGHTRTGALRLAVARTLHHLPEISQCPAA